MCSLNNHELLFFDAELRPSRNTIIEENSKYATSKVGPCLLCFSCFYNLFCLSQFAEMPGMFDSLDRISSRALINEYLIGNVYGRVGVGGEEGISRSGFLYVHCAL